MTDNEDPSSIHSDGGNTGGDDVIPGMPCSVDTLPLVVDQIKLMGFNEDCTSVSPWY